MRTRCLSARALSLHLALIPQICTMHCSASSAQEAEERVWQVAPEQASHAQCHTRRRSFRCPPCHPHTAAQQPEHHLGSRTLPMPCALGCPVAEVAHDAAASHGASSHLPTPSCLRQPPIVKHARMHQHPTRKVKLIQRGEAKYTSSSPFASWLSCGISAAMWPCVSLMVRPIRTGLASIPSHHSAAAYLYIPQPTLHQASFVSGILTDGVHARALERQGTCDRACHYAAECADN